MKSIGHLRGIRFEDLDRFPAFWPTFLRTSLFDVFGEFVKVFPAFASILRTA